VSKIKKAFFKAQAEIQKEADQRLYEIAFHAAKLEKLRAEYQAKVKEVTVKYAAKLEAFAALKIGSELVLIKIMKFNKGILFDGTDIVNLPHGSLIHNIADKVSIPKDALEKCKEMEFFSAIKIAESVDRDAIEKWPDAKLLLIGASRKTKEVFGYELKKVKSCQKK
jgi:hypothetical protein